MSVLWFSTLLLALFWFFVVAFFRDPRRVCIHDADLIFSPCDGRVVVTEVVRETEYMQEEMMQISVFMSITNVHKNWVPVGGVVEVLQIPPGALPGGVAPEVLDRERTHHDRGARILWPQGALPPGGGGSSRAASSLRHEAGRGGDTEQRGRIHQVWLAS